jgi:predicted DNA-binding transcriptional regulator AlpA
VRAAQYVGVSVVTFDKLVTDGRMPSPKRVDTRKIWDKHALDMAFEALPEDEQSKPNEWDVVL